MTPEQRKKHDAEIVRLAQKYGHNLRLDWYTVINKLLGITNGKPSTVTEVAQQLGLEVDEVYQIKHRAKNALRLLEREANSGQPTMVKRDEPVKKQRLQYLFHGTPARVNNAVKELMLAIDEQLLAAHEENEKLRKALEELSTKNKSIFDNIKKLFS